MEQEFQRADLEALMGGDALLDGQELSCGFVRIAAVGLLMDYSAKRGEEPLFDMSIFQRGDLVLPFPFSSKQFQVFCAWHPSFRWDVIEAEFTNDDGTIDDAALAELDSRNLEAGMLVRNVFGIGGEELRAWEQQCAIDDEVDDCITKIAEFENLKIETISDSRYRDESLISLNIRLQTLLRRQNPDSVDSDEQTKTLTAPEVIATRSIEFWKQKAQKRALEIIERDGAKDLYPSQVNIADEIAKQFRSEGVKGEEGKPITSGYIKRHALKGISSAQKKLASAVMHRSK